MKVILTKTIDQLGLAGEEKEVKPGFARNYLFVRRLAVLPTHPEAKSLRRARQALLKSLSGQQAMIQELAAQWRNQTYRITARASDDGTLYGSVGLKELRKALGRDDLNIDVPTLKTIGTHLIDITFADGTSIPVTVVIDAEARAGERAKK